jgi:glutamate dehydrogenase (NAD(P)+)
MSWIMDTFSMFRGHSVPAVVTGKPIQIGGSHGRSEAAARGAQFCIRRACERMKMPLAGARVAVQGFGATGASLAVLLHQDGAKIVAAGDSRGGVYRANGLEPEELLAHQRRTGTVTGFPGADAVQSAEVLECGCDILVPAALEKQIDAANAARIRARIVAEAADGAVEPEADRALYERGVFVIPDILCNGGGAAVSYFEWVQGLQSFFWDEEQVNSQLQRIMDRAFSQVREAMDAARLAPRAVAYRLAIERVAVATALRGIFP